METHRQGRIVGAVQKKHYHKLVTYPKNDCYFNQSDWPGFRMELHKIKKDNFQTVSRFDEILFTAAKWWRVFVI